ncbi:hypothetical protein JNUCC0626_10405 [Lentzea sp. JNUCC 0626]|uniref:hypothetical protein n=1 Tax=Lentzea sp. JNUCC 0626 TaxID=3367513 RepID=UPI00374830DA
MEHEDTLRATFAKLQGEAVPSHAHGAANVIRRGRAVRSRRRTAAVVGTAVATAAVAALALALLPSQPTTPEPGAPVPTETTTPGVLTTPTDLPP